MTKRRWLAIAGVLGILACMTLLVLVLKPAGPGGILWKCGTVYPALDAELHTWLARGSLQL